MNKIVSQKQENSSTAKRITDEYALNFSVKQQHCQNNLKQYANLITIINKKLYVLAKSLNWVLDVLKTYENVAPLSISSIKTEINDFAREVLNDINFEVTQILTNKINKDEVSLKEEAINYINNSLNGKDKEHIKELLLYYKDLLSKDIEEGDNECGRLKLELSTFKKQLNPTPIKNLAGMYLSNMFTRISGKLKLMNEYPDRECTWICNRINELKQQYVLTSNDNERQQIVAQIVSLTSPKI